MDIKLNARIEKTVPEQQLVFGWFSIIEKNGEPVVDTQDHIIESATLEKAAYDFVLNVRTAGENHKRMAVGKLVEFIVMTKEKQELWGIDLGHVGWWGGFQIMDKAVWEAIKTGEYESFSIGGTAILQGQGEK